MSLPVFALTLKQGCVGRFVAAGDVERLVAGLPGFATPAQLQQALTSLDLDEIHDMKLDEFQELMAALASGADGWSVRQGFQPVLTAYFLSLKDWQGQLRCIVAHRLPLRPVLGAVVRDCMHGKAYNALQQCSPTRAPGSTQPPDRRGCGTQVATRRAEWTACMCSETPSTFPCTFPVCCSDRMAVCMQVPVRASPAAVSGTARRGQHGHGTRGRPSSCR